jgi:hypothetical protein
MVSIDGHHAGCTTTPDPHGWYPDLFVDRTTAMVQTPTIADVHTQPSDESGNMIGRVLHVATAPPRMMIVTIAHDDGTHPRTYRGFVSTYAEVTTSGFRRYTDEDWAAELAKHPAASPDWLTAIRP